MNVSPQEPCTLLLKSYTMTKIMELPLYRKFHYSVGVPRFELGTSRTRTSFRFLEL
jgi:hypothetical protein